MIIIFVFLIGRMLNQGESPGQPAETEGLTKPKWFYIPGWIHFGRY
jgi:hypothetical protein